MIDLKALRADPDSYRSSQEARGEDPAAIDAVLAADAANRAGLVEFEALRAEQKALGKRIGPLQGAAKRGDAQAAADLQGLMAEAADLADRVKAAEARARAAESELAAAALVPSNLISAAAPVGGEEDFAVLAEVGTPRDFDAAGF
ncbi:MAG: serine--tRNA ligase, partial [Candidatus Nanopelagicales bacterium]